MFIITFNMTCMIVMLYIYSVCSMIVCFGALMFFDDGVMIGSCCCSLALDRPIRCGEFFVFFFFFLYILACA